MLKIAAALAAAASLACTSSLASSTAAAGDQTLAPAADAFVNAGSPSTNYGTSTILYTDGSPIFRSYLRFDLSGIAGQVVTRATLRIHAATSGSPGETVRVHGATGTSWTEGGITYANAPAVGAAVASAGSIAGGSWVSLDVTPLVKADGPLTLVVDSAGDTRIRFASRESATPPQLVVHTQPDAQPSFPIRAAFYYPWFPEAWSQNGITPYSHYTPSLGYYNSSDTATIAQHVHALQYANVQAAIASWWGRGSATDGRVQTLLSTTDSLASPLRWAVYYEPESQGDPTVAQIASDLTYLRDRYASDPAYLRVAGRFVVFVFASGSDGCGMADRWKQANDGLLDPAYVVLKVFNGYRTCASQPDGWHQYAPAVAEDAQSGYSFSISPGYWKAGTSTPLLARDATRWAQNVRDMVASNAPWQLVTTFNEWGEGTAIESSTDWGATYLDVLHANGGTGTASPPASTSPPTVSGTAQQGQTLTASPGTWSGTAPIAYAYQWQRCATTCAAVTGATSQTYTAVSADVGSRLRVHVTASNSAGSSTADSAQTAVVQAASSATPPASTSPPTVSGTAQQGQTLTASPGTWSGTAPIAYAYQWQRCATTCAAVTGATSQTYTAASSDVGSTLRVHVTASNSAGSSTADSAQTAVVQAAPSGGPCGTMPAPPATWKHVIWIWMENHSFSEIIGSSSAPYVNQLANQCGLATNYHGVAHPSLPNYIAGTSGGTQGITDDNAPSSHPLSVPSIFSQTTDAGLTWRSYQESMPSNCLLSSSGTYAVKHNPAAYYVPIRTACASWDVSSGTTSGGAFLSDLQNDTLPAFTFVTPNLCNDMHDCSVATGDAWLKAWVPIILASRGYTSANTVLVITWDEDDGSSSNLVPAVIVSPSTPAGTRSATSFNHYSLLRTAEEQLGLPATLGAAATAASMRSAFHF